MLIIIEGIDGCGKTSLISNISKILIEKGYNVFTTKEPSTNKYGMQLRLILQNKINPYIEPVDQEEFDKFLQLYNSIEEKKELNEYQIKILIQIFLFIKDREWHCKYEIEPQYAHSIILCDRYIDSMIAYQSVQSTFDSDSDKRLFSSIELAKYFLMVLNKEMIIPDLVILLDIPVYVSLERCGLRSNGQMEQFENEKILSKVRSEFLKLQTIRSNPITSQKKRYLINGIPSQKQVEQTVLNCLLKEFDLEIKNKIHKSVHRGIPSIVWKNYLHSIPINIKKI